jgi:pyruvate formate lyase activating enzyme
MKRRLFIQSSFSAIGLLAAGKSWGNFYEGNFTMPDKEFSCEALFYKTTPRGIKCNLCPHNCNVTEIRPGSCRTKFVKNGKLISTAFGNPYYVKTVTPENENLYHFLPGEKILALGTAGCNLSCQYCNVSHISQKTPAAVSFSPLFPEQAVNLCLSKGIKAIVYTYSEPIAFYEYMLETARLAKSKGIKNIMVSNGFINDAPLREIIKYLDAAVISIKAFSDSTYQKLSGATIFPVFETIKTLKEMNIWLELTHVVVPGWTDNAYLLEKMCNWLHENDFADTPFHLQRFDPKYRLGQLKPVTDELMKKMLDTSTAKGLNNVYEKSFQNHTVCPKCKKVVITRTGNNTSFKGFERGSCSCGHKIPGFWIL